MIKCLAIDDDPLFLRLLSVLFNDIPEAQLVSSHSNSVEGVMAVVKEKPDVLLLDLEMPYLDGFEALETLDNYPKVIVISGHLNQPFDHKLPIDRFMSKSNISDAATLRNAILSVTATNENPSPEG